MDLNRNHSYNEQGHFISAHISGFVKLEDFKEVCLATIRWMVRQKTGKVLVDISRLMKMPNENEQWIQQVWFPKALSMGLSKMAFVVPKDSRAEAGAKEANKATDGDMLPIPLEYFGSVEEAEAWLTQD